MSDTFENITEQIKAQRQRCRVAYTINNTQPVISTIIGDQPLFYMDFDGAYEDQEDLSLDAAEMKILDSEIQSLRSEIETIERFSKSFSKDSKAKFIDFLSNGTDMTHQSASHVANDIEGLLESLRQSRLATAYLACAEQYAVKISYSMQITGSQYDRAAGTIIINPNMEWAEQQLLCVQELRRHWQHRQGALINPLMFHPDNAVLVHRAQVADLAVSMIRAAWELQLSGDKRAWDRIENSTMADLGRAFAREAFLDFRTINNGQASAAVFEAWFLTERCRAQDKILINQMLADYKGYVFDLAQAEQSITPSLIAALGEMPFGKNYLAEHALTILNDSIFTDVRDRSNANFLWFIKFERSFRETEQELQTTIDPTAGDVHHPAYKNQIRDQGYEFNATPSRGQTPGNPGEIIHLFGSDITAGDAAVDKSGEDSKRLAPNARIKRRNHEDARSNVVYVNQWSSRLSGE